MSKPTSNLHGKDLKQYYGIAKICFYIMIFNIVVRLELWISIAGVIILMPYLLHRLLLKKIDVVKYLSLFNNYFNAVKNATKKPDISQIKATYPTKSTEVNFANPSFEEIWQDYQQVDFMWDEPDH